MPEASLVFLVVAAALHAGFQFTVTAVVYPALVATDPAGWRRAHRAHSRSITPIVALTYAALLIGAGWALWTTPSSIGVWVSAGGAALSMSVTALVAAPTHTQLTAKLDPTLLRRLIRSDRLRSAGALIALLGGGFAALG